VSLDLSSARLDQLPPEIGQLSTLQVLYLRGNKLTTLPAEIGQLTGLTHLDLEDNRLDILPAGILQLTALRTLDLRVNRLRELPPEIGRLKALRTLILTRNALRSLPAEIGQLVKLVMLEIGDNQLVEIPPDIGRLIELGTLRVSNNNLQALPSGIGGLIALRNLNLSGNRLYELPPEIGKLEGLQHLYVGKNQLSSLPPDIVRIPKLRTLDLSQNRFAVLPAEIVRLKSLTTLRLANNRMTVLPSELMWLENLQTLDLADNALKNMPPEIGQLTRLKQLDIRNNKLRTLPLAFGRLRALAANGAPDFDVRSDGLLLDGNPLPDPYPALIADGQPQATAKILSLLRGEIDSGDAPNGRPQAEESNFSAEPPSLPPQGVGPHFEVDEKGVIRFAPPEALDRDGNNVRRLRALHPTIRSLSRELSESLGRGNSPHGHLCARIEAYRDLVDQDLGLIDFSLLYIEGVRIANAERAAVQKADQGELPPFELSDREALDTLLQLHGNFMMSSIEGIEAIAEEERYRRRPDEEIMYRAAAMDFAESLQNNPDVIDQDVAAVVLGAAEQIGRGANVERSGVVGTATLKNVTIILAAGATIALPVVGGAVFGLGGTMAGALAGLFAGEGVKRSDAFGAVILPLSRTIDNASKVEASKFAEGVASRLKPQLNFVLRMEQKLRELAGRREQFGWIYNTLDWIKKYAKEDDNDTS
jgi:Leucine-rich repeat (LRR) protein